MRGARPSELQLDRTEWDVRYGSYESEAVISELPESRLSGGVTGDGGVRIPVLSMDAPGFAAFRFRQESARSGYSLTARFSPCALRVTSAMAAPSASVSNVSSTSATLQKNLVALEA